VSFHIGLCGHTSHFLFPNDMSCGLRIFRTLIVKARKVVSYWKYWQLGYCVIEPMWMKMHNLILFFCCFNICFLDAPESRSLIKFVCYQFCVVFHRRLLCWPLKIVWCGTEALLLVTCKCSFVWVIFWKLNVYAAHSVDFTE